MSDFENKIVIDLSKIFNGAKYMRRDWLIEKFETSGLTREDAVYTVDAAIEDGYLIKHVAPNLQPSASDFYLEYKG